MFGGLIGKITGGSGSVKGGAPGAPDAPPLEELASKVDEVAVPGAPEAPAAPDAPDAPAAPDAPDAPSSPPGSAAPTKFVPPKGGLGDCLAGIRAGANLKKVKTVVKGAKLEMDGGAAANGDAAPSSSSSSSGGAVAGGPPPANDMMAQLKAAQAKRKAGGAPLSLERQKQPTNVTVDFKANLKKRETSTESKVPSSASSSSAAPVTGTTGLKKFAPRADVPSSTPAPVVEDTLARRLREQAEKAAKGTSSTTTTVVNPKAADPTPTPVVKPTVLKPTVTKPNVLSSTSAPASGEDDALKAKLNKRLAVEQAAKGGTPSTTTTTTTPTVVEPPKSALKKEIQPKKTDTNNPAQPTAAASAYAAFRSGSGEEWDGDHHDEHQAGTASVADIATVQANVTKLVTPKTSTGGWFSGLLPSQPSTTAASTASSAAATVSGADTSAAVSSHPSGSLLSNLSSAFTAVVTHTPAHSESMVSSTTADSLLSSGSSASASVGISPAAPTVRFASTTDTIEPKDLASAWVTGVTSLTGEQFDELNTNQWQSVEDGNYYSQDRHGNYYWWDSTDWKPWTQPAGTDSSSSSSSLPSSTTHPVSFDEKRSFVDLSKSGSGFGSGLGLTPNAKKLPPPRLPTSSSSSLPSTKPTNPPTGLPLSTSSSSATATGTPRPVGPAAPVTGFQVAKAIAVNAMVSGLVMDQLRHLVSKISPPVALAGAVIPPVVLTYFASGNWRERVVTGCNRATGLALAVNTGAILATSRGTKALKAVSTLALGFIVAAQLGVAGVVRSGLGRCFSKIRCCKTHTS